MDQRFLVNARESYNAVQYTPALREAAVKVLRSGISYRDITMVTNGDASREKSDLLTVVFEHTVCGDDDNALLYSAYVNARACSDSCYELEIDVPRLRRPTKTAPYGKRINMMLPQPNPGQLRKGLHERDDGT